MTQDRPKPLSLYVADAILDYVDAQGAQPGDNLPTEAELSEQLSVSRTAVREALKELQAIGVIHTRHGQGSFVSRIAVPELFDVDDAKLRMVEINPEELLHIAEVRYLIEGQTAMLAAQNATPDQLANIKAHLDSMIKTGGVGPENFKPDLRFHLAIAQASGNLVYPTLLRVLMYLLVRYEEEIVESFPEPYPGATIVVHRRIYEAIAARSPAEARAAMEKHLEENIIWARQRLEKLKARAEGASTHGAPVGDALQD